MDKNQIFEHVYDELRSLARHYLSKERPGSTLQPTALVNEAYIKLQNHRDLKWKSHTHFIAIAAQAMRQVLIDIARKRNALKRCSDRVDITLSVIPDSSPISINDFLSLHSALEKLAAKTPNGARHAQLIEYVWFGGLGLSEAADHLGISRRQAGRDWAYARTWLEKELST